MVYFASVAVLVAIGVFVFDRTTRAGYESAEYKVIEADGNFEVREYPDLVLVATTIQIDAQSRDGKHRVCFTDMAATGFSAVEYGKASAQFLDELHSGLPNGSWIIA